MVFGAKNYAKSHHDDSDREKKKGGLVIAVKGGRGRNRAGESVHRCSVFGVKAGGLFFFFKNWVFKRGAFGMAIVILRTGSRKDAKSKTSSFWGKNTNKYQR